MWSEINKSFLFFIGNMIVKCERMTEILQKTKSTVSERINMNPVIIILLLTKTFFIIYF